MRGRGDKCINMRVLKADVSWGWGICSVICSFRRHLSLGVRALLQEVCNNPPPTPPQPSGRGGSVTAGAQGPRPRPPPSCGAALPRTGGGGTWHDRLAWSPAGLGPEPHCGEGAGETCRRLRESVLPAAAPSPPQLLLLPAAAPGAALSPLFGDREERSGLNERFCVTTT